MTPIDPQALFQQVVLDHYRKPRNHGELARPTVSAAATNPFCGDRVALQLHLEGDRIEEVRFQGRGCSISQASASMLTVLLKGRTTGEARRLMERFALLVEGSEEAARDVELGDLRVLQGVHRFPARVRCARLPFEALESALEARHET